MCLCLYCVGACLFMCVHAFHIQEHELSASGSCTDCNRPMADKMADFALESQGLSPVPQNKQVKPVDDVRVSAIPYWYKNTA